MQDLALEQHRWLRKLCGEWAYESTSLRRTGEPPQTLTGWESVRALGDDEVVAGSSGGVQGGGAASSVRTLRFDAHTGRFSGSWVGSTMNGLWLYEGSLAADPRTLTLQTEGPAADGLSERIRMRDVTEWLADDHRVTIIHAQRNDGLWTPLMISHYRRLKHRLGQQPTRPVSDQARRPQGHHVAEPALAEALA